jgi:hypothetical protein
MISLHITGETSLVKSAESAGNGPSWCVSHCHSGAALMCSCELPLRENYFNIKSGNINAGFISP